jgi:hypothetical protein
MPAHTIPGAEYAPIPPGAWCWRVNGLGHVHRERAPLGSPDMPGPHHDAYRGERHPWVADLMDDETALRILKRALTLRRAPPRAAALAQVALAGRWGASQAEQLGRLCEQLWKPEAAHAA